MGILTSCKKNVIIYLHCWALAVLPSVGLGALTAREAEGKTGDKVRVFTIPISFRAKKMVMVLECSDDSVMESVMHNEVML